MREVFEETGVKTKYVGLLGFRLLSPVKFGCDDIYFACLLEAESKEINIDKDEISESKWVKLHEFFEMKLTKTQSELQIMIKEYLEKKRLLMKRKEILDKKKQYYFYN